PRESSLARPRDRDLRHRGAVTLAGGIALEPDAERGAMQLRCELAALEIEMAEHDVAVDEPPRPRPAGLGECLRPARLIAFGARGCIERCRRRIRSRPRVLRLR